MTQLGPLWVWVGIGRGLRDFLKVLPIKDFFPHQASNIATKRGGHTDARPLMGLWSKPISDLNLARDDPQSGNSRVSNAL